MRGLTNNTSESAPVTTDPSIASPLDRIIRVTLLADRLIVIFHPEHEADDAEPRRLVMPFRLSTKTGRSQTIRGDRDGPRHDPVLIRALRKAYAQMQRDALGGPVLDAATYMIRARRILRLTFLAPDLQRAILEERQPRHVPLAHLIESDIPPLWSDQRLLFSASPWCCQTNQNSLGKRPTPALIRPRRVGATR